MGSAFCFGILLEGTARWRFLWWGEIHRAVTFSSGGHAHIWSETTQRVAGQLLQAAKGRLLRDSLSAQSAGGSFSRRALNFYESALNDSIGDLSMINQSQAFQELPSVSFALSFSFGPAAR